MFDVILYDKGRNSVEQNAIVHDNSDRSLLRPQAPLLQSPYVVNQWISKDLSCDALSFYRVLERGRRKIINHHFVQGNSQSCQRHATFITWRCLNYHRLANLWHSGGLPSVCVQSSGRFYYSLLDQSSHVCETHVPLKIIKSTYDKYALRLIYIEIYMITKRKNILMCLITSQSLSLWFQHQNLLYLFYKL